MSRLKELESKKLLKELEYIESDYNYKNELVGEADTEFIRCLNLFLEKHPPLKDLFDNKINKRIEEVFTKKQQEIESIVQEQFDNDIEQDIIETEEVTEEKPIKIKKLYREIVKATHPDRVTSKKLVDLYLKATKFYNENDFAGTYSICNELNIPFEIDEFEKQVIEDKISSLKDRIRFMESTITWRWFNSQEIEKEKLLLEYLKFRLND